MCAGVLVVTVFGGYWGTQTLPRQRTIPHKMPEALLSNTKVVPFCPLNEILFELPIVWVKKVFSFKKIILF